ncbi:MAG: hypothetical protein JNM07_12450 [Phycisphaerae bacterium]|nr:hypothetical protein [Phycisphaerae bacterium]
MTRVGGPRSLAMMALGSFAESEQFVWVLVIGAVTLIWLGKQVASVIRGGQRERTRREIAAYIAEGSLTPEQGERLMKAGESPHHS